MNLLRVGLALVASLSLACSEVSPPPVAWTLRVDPGEVRATARGDGSFAFLGIPYAAPPTGALRWRPPVAPASWSVAREAAAFGPSCAQVLDPEESTSRGAQSEDCLSLNVWTPGAARAGAPRPVMVFIHGGGWTNGGTADPWYDGASLSRRGDAVIVSMNYRLGVFGFLDLSDPAAGGRDYVSSGTLGLQDQFTALRWVSRNIAAFGGDPNNVTVFGHSAGAMSLTALLAMPECRGLFRRAIVQSGAASLYRSSDVGRRIAARVMEAASATTLPALRALSTDALLAAERSFLDGVLVENLTFAPTIDGVFLRESPLAVLARGEGARVPILTGTVATEARYWILYNPLFGALAPDVALTVFPWITRAVGTDRVASIVAGYRARRPTSAAEEITLALATDVFFRLPQVRLAEAQAAGGGTAYMYQFAWRTPVLGGRLQSPHGVEVPFVFGSTAAAGDFVGASPPADLTARMQDVWLGFARNGEPPAPDGSRWPAYTTTSRATWILDLTSRREDNPAGDDLRAWDGVPFDSITPAVDPLGSAL